MTSTCYHWLRSAFVAVITVTLAAAVSAQPQTRIGNRGPDLRDFDQLIRDGVPADRVRRQDPFARPSDVDLTRVDRGVLRNLLEECISISNDLYNSLRQDYQRNPEVRVFLRDVDNLSARVKRAAAEIRQNRNLEYFLPELRQLATDWRVASHRMNQSRVVSNNSLRFVERIDRLERELEKLFQLEAQIDRQALIVQLSHLESAIGNLMMGLEYESSNGADNLRVQIGKLDQQAYLIQRKIASQYEYTDIVMEFHRFDRLWDQLLPQLRRINNRQIQASLNSIGRTGSEIHDLLWLEQSTDRNDLRQVADALGQDVDEFFNRVPLKLLLSLKNVNSILQTSDEFYDSVQALKLCLDENRDDQALLSCYRNVERIGQDFIVAFQPLRSSTGRVVLRQIEDGISLMRTELNLAGPVANLDLRALSRSAAALDNYSDHLRMNMEQWLRTDRPSFSNAAMTSIDRFSQRSRNIHRSLILDRPTANELRREIDDLWEEFRDVYNYASRCNTDMRDEIKDVIFDIRDSIDELESPLKMR